ncbi:hypothetical protein BDV93DRAFT_521119 [Ceratobasidium sp. AG-I]|nr:hypothetical protein BDV93DRAFT_521119 [Ceratobasidium sp. AG-I]
MRNLLNFNRLHAWVGLTVVVFLGALSTFEFGSLSIQSNICQAVYRDTKLTTYVDGFPHSMNASMLIAEALALREGRPVSAAVASGKVIHQSWKTRYPPANYHSMMSSWRNVYPDWEYVLWNDDDNLELVKTFYPEWIDAYLALPSNIYRADFSRNLYMYTFGGIYADLDSEAVSPLAPLLAAQDPASALSVPIAFLGSMDTYLQEIHSIPNAFMASSAPGHPLWLIAAQDAVNWCRARVWDVEAPLPDPEFVTGPVALRRSVITYSPTSLEFPFTLSESDTTFTPETSNNTFAPVVVFSPDVIYPFTWDHPRPKVLAAGQECVCRMNWPTFDPGMCKQMTGARWAINYWKHSW